MSLPNRYKNSSLEEKRFILTSLFNSYAHIHESDYSAALVELNDSFSLLGDKNNKTYKVIAEHIMLNNYGKASYWLKELIKQCIKNFAPQGDGHEE